MGWGDEIMATGQARKAYDDHVEKQNSPMKVRIRDAVGNKRWHPAWENNPIIAGPDDYEATLNVKNGPHARPYIKYPFSRDTGWNYSGWKASDYPGELYFSDDERRVGASIAEGGPFVMIEPNIKDETTVNRSWSWSWFTEVVRMNPEIRWVQPTYSNVRALPGVETFQSSFREACAVLAQSIGFLGTEGGFAHAAGGMGKDAVVIFGGCIDPVYLGYPFHHNLVGDLPETPCGRFVKCEHCAKAMALITPDVVSSAVVEMVEG